MFKYNHYKLFLTVLVLDLYSRLVLLLPLFISPLFLSFSWGKNGAHFVFQIIYGKLPSTVTTEELQGAFFFFFFPDLLPQSHWICNIAGPFQSSSLTRKLPTEILSTGPKFHLLTISFTYNCVCDNTMLLLLNQ